MKIIEWTVFTVGTIQSMDIQYWNSGVRWITLWGRVAINVNSAVGGQHAIGGCTTISVNHANV